ncbi:Protein CBG26693 [Caenorhabditis briggsae]|uniref:Protein CBG26693 n=1 Tax=Caenorhabditis briggsae TaxID=6238 RepID=B6IE65_CAEBR|nr:Protein CBG26693 [Caenorhabditis briggsae]CAS01129.1 Protein CBG26693 [Caenorhabditis briggsae]
MSYIRNGVQ